MKSDYSTLEFGPTRLERSLFLPQEPRRLIILAHGSGSWRFSPRTRFVAERLATQGDRLSAIRSLAAEEGELDHIALASRCSIRSPF